MLRITTNLKGTFYEDKEKQDIMIEFYLLKRNLKKRTISISFVRPRTFDRARKFTRTFDRGVVWRQNNDLNFFRRIFHYAAGKSGMCMNFLLVEWKK